MTAPVRERVPWQIRAACRGTSLSMWEDQAAVTDAHRAVCGGCPVRVYCAIDALETRAGHGVVRAGVLCERHHHRATQRTNAALRAVLDRDGVQVTDA